MLISPVTRHPRTALKTIWPRTALKTIWSGGIALAVCAAIAGFAVNSPASAQSKIPALGTPGVGWLGGAEWRDPPKGMRGPIRNDPAFPYRGNNDGLGQPTVRMGNW